MAGGDTSKTKLCGIPVTGDLIFCPRLETVLDRTADRKKSFPVKHKLPQPTKKRSWVQNHFLTPRAKRQKKALGTEGEAKEQQFFALLTKSVKLNGKLTAVGGGLGAFLPQWKAISSSQFSLRIVRRGYHLEVSKPPPNRLFITELQRGPGKARGLLEALRELKEQNVVSRVTVGGSRQGLLLSRFPGAKAFRKVQTDTKSKASKPVSNIQKISYGLNIFSKGAASSKLLYGIHRSEGCILAHPYRPELSTIFRVGSKNRRRNDPLADSSASVWPILSP